MLNRIDPTVKRALHNIGKCMYCGNVGKVSIDHIYPISKGGGHEIDNLTTACLSCNSHKSNNLIPAFIASIEKKIPIHLTMIKNAELKYNRLTKHKSHRAIYYKTKLEYLKMKLQYFNNILDNTKSEKYIIQWQDL